MTKVTVVIITFLLFAGLFFLLSDKASSDEINGNFLYVGGSEEGNYSSIQDAINNAEEKDTIFVYKGIYNESILISKSINLIGEDKKETIIRNNTAYIVKLYTTWINLSGFTIKDSDIAGILIVDSYCNIYQNIITENRVGIIIESSRYIFPNNSKIFNNTISNNRYLGISIPKFLPADDFYSCSTNNIFYHNNFQNNTNHVKDNCNNIWSYNNEGNFWDDYSGLDKNNDGIGDNPYEIIDENNYDNYPLMMPYAGKLRLKEYYVDDEALYTMLFFGIIVAILFCLPIAYVWYQKFHKAK